MHYIYSAFLAAALILSSPLWFLRMVREGKYRAGLAERFGRVPSRLRQGGGPTRRSIWVHAVSVGEVLAIAGLVQRLRRAYPDHRVLVSTTTATGQALARQKFGEETVFYFPLDFSFAVRAYLAAIRPELVVVAETEFWPNFLRLARAYGAQVAVINARISDRSLPRYRRFRRLVGRVLGPVSVFLCQSEEDERRLNAIGAIPERVQVAGNLKFDSAPPKKPPVIVEQLRSAMISGGAGPVIVAGSTVEGEEPAVLEAFRSVLSMAPNAVLVLAARHPERFPAVMEIAKQSGLRIWRRSEWSESEVVCGGVFVLDTIGELGALYALADVAFVGGSLAPRGGHNILEPAMYGVATVVGPHTENFRDIIELFVRADAVKVVANTDALSAQLSGLLKNAAMREKLGQRAAELVRQQAGATERTLTVLDQLLKQDVANAERR